MLTSKLSYTFPMKIEQLVTSDNNASLTNPILPERKRGLLVTGDSRKI